MKSLTLIRLIQHTFALNLLGEKMYGVFGSLLIECFPKPAVSADTVSEWLCFLVLRSAELLFLLVFPSVSEL